MMLGLLGAASLACVRRADVGGSDTRILSLGGPLTELLFALGVGDRLVGADTSSYYPSEAEALPKVGYQRQISVEGVLALAPTLVVHSDQAGPKPALEQIAAAGIELVEFADPWELDAARRRIRDVAALVGRVDAGAELIAALDKEIAELERLRAACTSTPTVLFVYARGADHLLVAGRHTAPATMVELAGGRLALQHEGFVPISAEAVIAGAPEVILVTSRGLGSVGGQLGMLDQPGLAETPAGRARRVIALDDLALLGFGPRTGATLIELTRALHPELS
jgi:iron complex transport system substrate-binding protein